MLLPACLAWFAARMLIDRRWPEPAERKLILLLAAIVVVYLPLWQVASTVAGSPASKLQIAPIRGLIVLRNSAIAVVPLGEDMIHSVWCLLLPLGLAALAAIDRDGSGRKEGYLVLSLSLWLLSAMIFVFTAYPWGLQLYYSHFSVIGLSLLAALAVASLQVRLRSWQNRLETGSRPATGAWANTPRLAGRAAVLLLGGWVALSVLTIYEGIRHRQSPALSEADLSKNIHDQLKFHLSAGSYHEVVLVGIAPGTWASTQYGTMMRLFFPNVTVRCDGRDRFKPPANIQTSVTTLVVRETAEGKLTVVR